MNLAVVWRKSGVRQELKLAGGCEIFRCHLDVKHVDGQKMVTVTERGMTGRGKVVWGEHKAIGTC